MAQWASAYAEAALGLSKALGDLAGPCMFAVTMGISRIIFGKYGEQVRFNEVYEWFRHIMRCLLSTCRFVIQPDYRTYRLYCMWIFSWNHVAWNNQYFLKTFPTGERYVFSSCHGRRFRCSIGPGIVGRITQNAGNNIRIGMGFGLIFPVILLFMLFLLYRKKSTQPQISKH